MGRIGVDQLNEGMIVDDPVCDFHGTVLMQKGTVITPKGIKILKMWGVLEVSVDDVSAVEHRASPERLVDPSFEEEAKREVDSLFQHVQHSNVFVKELMRFATNRIIKSRLERG
jgi:F0F1-type ATP synthase epsilon subunit